MRDLETLAIETLLGFAFAFLVLGTCLAAWVVVALLGPWMLALPVAIVACALIGRQVNRILP